MNYYPNYNQFYGQTIPQGMPKIQPMEQQFPQYAQPQPIYKQPVGLQGKSVDSIDVVKAMDIPLDGTISYFPLTDGTAIVTKQLQQDGSSKTMVYKPVVEEEVEKTLPKYITAEELDKNLKKVDNTALKDEIKNIKRQLEDLTDDMKDINEKIRKRKD
jgi:hypothetical protein